MARIARPVKSRRKRLASPYFRAVQDAHNDDGHANPFRPGTEDHARYEAGAADAAAGVLEHVLEDDFLLPPDYNPA